MAFGRENNNNPSDAIRERRTRGRGRRVPLWLSALAWLFALGCLAAGGVVAAVLIYYSSQVPDFRQLADYKPSLITKVYDRDGGIMAEYARERRVWVPIQDVPQPVIKAFLAAEDSNFFNHGGYDSKAIIRAIVSNVFTHRMQGGSTITQQVAKTFLLSSERTYTRKIKELILSWRIEQAFTKNEILELYLNRIYLGNGAYGIAAAAETYFSKSLDELTLPERAMLGGMPQAPTRYNPVRNPSAAHARRDIVLRRMQAENFITKADADAAVASPLTLNVTPLKNGEDAPAFSEMIRRQIEKTYGSDALYNDGLIVYTTLDLKMQQQAENAVYQGLKAYDRRHGWRGPVTHISVAGDWDQQLDDLGETYASAWRVGEPAVVLTPAGKTGPVVGLSGGIKGTIQPASLKWTGRSATSLFKAGDVIFVKKLGTDTSATTTSVAVPDTKADINGGSIYTLEQLPKVQGALVALDVHTGNVLAMVGGLGETAGGFNRATQALRQPGSSFKPFVYAAALEKGYTPATTVLDAPITFGEGDTTWSPHNYENKINGNQTLRFGLEHSLNLMTVRMAQDIGLRSVADVVKRLGFSQPMPITDLSVVLGSLSENLMDMTNAYAAFPRGGVYLPPTVLQRVQDAHGTTLMRSPPVCDLCLASSGASDSKEAPELTTSATQVLSPQLAYLMTNLLQGVVQYGTGSSLRDLGRPIGGKTGTTNDFVDAWFIGFSPSLAIGVWVGNDTPSTLGNGETGAHAALPIWKTFAQSALQNTPVENFNVPEGVNFVKIDRDSGLLPGSDTRRTLLEAFVAGTEPSRTTPVHSMFGSFGANSNNSENNNAGDEEAPAEHGSHGGNSGQGNGQGNGHGGHGVIQQLFNAFGIY